MISARTLQTTQRLQWRSDVSPEWYRIDPVLAEGEPGYELDTGYWKVGDGVLSYSQLPYMNDRGPEGPEGPVGPQGVPGPAGDPGATGATGATGPQGSTGAPNVLTIGTVAEGAAASASITGTTPSQVLNLVLPKGSDGAVGPAGPQGIQGPTGLTGATGATGPVGPAGPTGPQGPKGDAAGINLKGYATQWPPAASPTVNDLYILPDPLPSGTPAGFNPGDGAHWSGLAWHNTGPIRGPQGPQGAAGATGATGAKGDPGAVGPAGPQGVAGPAGSTGPAGPQGPAGVPNVLSVGSVTTVAPDGAPVVTITGNSPSQQIDFGIPAPYVPSLTIGSVTTGPTAAASITGTSPAWVLNLVLPQGSGGETHTTTFTQNPADAISWDGGSVTFTALAASTDSPILYKWQWLNVGQWQDIAGATSSTYTLTVATADDGKQYRCLATTPNTTAASTVATLTVGSKPAPGTNWTGSHNAWFSGPVSYLGGTTMFCFPAITRDGKDWSNVAPPGGISSQTPLWGNGFYATGRGISTLGDSWSATAPLGSTGVASTFAYGTQGNRYLGVYPTVPFSRPGDPIPTTTYDLYETQDGYTFSVLPIASQPIADPQVFLKYLKIVGMGGLWIGTCYSPADGAERFIYSTNGTTWAFTTSGDTLPVNSVADIGKVRFAVHPQSPFEAVAIKPGLYAWSTTNGISWTRNLLPTSAQWSAVHCGDDGAGNRVYMAVASQSRVVITSTDGSTWVESGTLPEAGDWDSVCYFKGRWYAHKVRKAGESYSMAISG